MHMNRGTKQSVTDHWLNRLGFLDRFSFFKNMSMPIKLLSLVASAMLLLILIAAIGLFYSNKMQQNAILMYEQELIPLHTLHEMKAAQHTIDAFLLEIIAEGDISPSAVSLQNEKMNTLNADVGEKIVRVNEFSMISDEQRNEFRTLFAEYRVARDQVLKNARLSDANRALLNEQPAYDEFNEQVKPLQERFHTMIQDLVEAYLAKAEEYKLATELSYNNSMLLQVLVAGGCLLLLSVLGLMISYFIVVPLRSIRAQMKQAEEGNLNLTVGYRSNDEVGALSASFNNMIAGIHGLVSEVKSGAQVISASSLQLTTNAYESSRSAEHVAQSTEQLASGMENNVSSVQATSDAVQHVSGSIHHIARQCDDMNKITSRASEQSNEGAVVVASVKAQMQHIAEDSRKTAQSIEQLSDKSQAIGQIVDVIQEMANQTQLLALNASIEAARAGEAGRGFEVVAKEVKKLANQSAEQGKLITALVKDIQLMTTQAIASVKQSSATVDRGVSQTDQVQTVFEGIHQAMHDVVSKVDTVHASVQSLSKSSDKIVEAMGIIAKVAEDGSATSQQITAANEQQLASMLEIDRSAKQLNELSEQMNTTISRFKL